MGDERERGREEARFNIQPGQTPLPFGETTERGRLEGWSQRSGAPLPEETLVWTLRGIPGVLEGSEEQKKTLNPIKGSPMRCCFKSWALSGF